MLFDVTLVMRIVRVRKIDDVQVLCDDEIF
jgi:hypothetical protein